MRIGVISTSQIPSTTANSIQVMKVCQAYRQLGHKVSLIIPGKEKNNWNDLSEIYGLSDSYDISYIPSLKIFRRYDFSILAGFMILLKKIELVHTWMPQIALISGFIETPYFLELHEMPTGKIGPRLFKKILFSKQKKRFLPITSALKDMFQKEFNYKFDQNEVRIAPDGVDLERYQDLPHSTQLKKDLGIQDTFTAVYTGHLYAGRGMDLLVELARRLPEFQFLWVGGRDEEVNHWKNFLKEKNINNITLTGFVKNVKIPHYQSMADVLLMPYENQISGSSGGNTADYCSPMKMFEYMATGKPIITSDLPVFHEVLNNENAIFCDYFDKEQWVTTIKQIQESPNQSKKLGDQAKMDVKKYTWIERAKNTLDGFIR
ncbi:MAG: glycosyltransferase [Anaerolineaceae bacterium]|nr:glycosyltransferase [Anaerolineaceae bacterium]